MEPRNWYLEDIPLPGGERRRVALKPLPFLVGRRYDSDLVLDTHHASQRHAELFHRDGGLWLRDLGSTNGTTVNGDPVTVERRLEDGDIIHFADLEFRLLSHQAKPSSTQTQVLSQREMQKLATRVRQPRAFREMLSHNQVQVAFQPLVRLADGTRFGFEVLGRGDLDGHPVSPAELFYLAQKLHRESELSAAFRERGVEQAKELSGDPVLFLNTHPEELKDCDALLESLAGLRQRHPRAELVLEIHEAAIADADALRALHQGLAELGVDLAFDDFGTGQARLRELIEAAPHYVKFDAALVQGIHLASRKRREMLEGLVHLVSDMEIAAVAECLEVEDEVRILTDMGFELGQGYHLGRPAPAASFLAEDPDDTVF